MADYRAALSEFRFCEMDYGQNVTVEHPTTGRGYVIRWGRHISSAPVDDIRAALFLPKSERQSREDIYRFLNG